MNLAALFSLISAALLGLLPVLLLFGRRRMQRRSPDSDASELSAQGEDAQRVTERPAGRRPARSTRRPVEPVDRDRRREREPRVAAITAGARLETRLARLTPLQRAIVYGEILGPPVALREPGRRDAR